MSKGKVKYFNENRGWGIIARGDFDQDIYVHYTAIKMNGYKTLKEGQQVLFDLAESELGPRAVNVLPQH